MNPAPALCLDEVVVVRGGKPVLALPALSVPAGQLTAVVGDNGSGKTTLLLTAAGLLDLAQGQVKLFGQTVFRGKAPAGKTFRRMAALAFQDPYLFTGTVRTNLELGLRFRGVDKQERTQRVDALIHRLSLSELAARRADELSGGERKLVELARAAVLNPGILLLDEATANLDESVKSRVEEFIADLVSRQKTTVILATHDVEQANRLAQHKLILCAGKMKSAELQAV